MSLMDDAREFARHAHQGQTYGHGDFHTIHLIRVEATLERLGETQMVLLAAAWLHDVVEHTSTTVEDVRTAFGDEVADLVHRLTDEKGGNRRERQEKTHAKIRGLKDAVRVKLADRIANVEYCIETCDIKLDGMYRKEYPRFREHLFRAGEFDDMWVRSDLRGLHRFLSEYQS